MREYIKQVMNISLIVIALSLVGCGGGGSGNQDSGENQTDSENSVQFGSFSVLPVSGLFYETETLSGLTDGQGRFRFREGETIGFRLGQTQLGGAQAKAEISPAELLGFEPVLEETEIIQLLGSPMLSSLDLVLNINTLLMSLDKDGNPENGIQLGSAHQQLETSGELDIAIKAKDFSATPAIKDLINSQVARDPKTLEFVASKLYEALGLSISVMRTSGAQAAANGEVSETLSAVYNESGEVASESVLLGSGEQPLVLAYEYDSENRLKRLSNTYTGEAESLTYQSGQLVQRSIESDDSNMLYQESMEYDNEGQLLQLSTDRDGDGNVDMISRFDPTETGEKVSVTRIENGEHTESLKLTKINEGLTESILEDYDSDGQMDLEMHYSYDQFSRLSTRRIISNDPAIESNVSYFEYDDQDRLIRYTVDMDNNGEIDYIEEYAYDYYDNRTVFKRDQDADGVWNYSAFYRFDAQGNRIEIIEDTDGDGINDHHWQAEIEQTAIESNWQNVFSGFLADL